MLCSELQTVSQPIVNLVSRKQPHTCPVNKLQVFTHQQYFFQCTGEMGCGGSKYEEIPVTGDI